MDIQDRTVGIQPSTLLSAACNAFTHISFDTQVPSHTDTLHRDAFAHRYFHTDRSFYSQQFYAQKIFTHKKKLHADVSTYTKKHVHTVAFSPSNWYKQKVFCTQQFLRAENFLYTEKHRSVAMFLHTNNILHQGAFAHFAHSCYTEKVFAQMFPLKGFTNISFCTQSLLKTHVFTHRSGNHAWIVRIGRWCRQRIGRCFWIPRTGTGSNDQPLNDDVGCKSEATWVSPKWCFSKQLLWQRLGEFWWVKSPLVLYWIDPKHKDLV